MIDPPLDQLADDDDQLDWDVERDGRMRDHATAYDTVSTELFTPPGSEL